MNTTTTVAVIGAIAVGGVLGLLLVMAFVAFTVVLGQRVELLRDTASRVLGVG